MKKIMIHAVLAAFILTAGACSQPGDAYEAAGLLDDLLVEKAQKKIARIENTDIEVRATGTDMLTFQSSYAGINAEENWVQPYYTFAPEDMTGYQGVPNSINGIVLAKMKSKDKIDADFGISDNETPGICYDVQQEIYETVLGLLTDEQRQKYLNQGKQLAFIPDDDLPPLSDSTNPVNQGSFWLDVDPAAMITRNGSAYSYEPLSLFVEFDDPDFQDVDEKYRGVRYCKFLSHQAVLSWMLTKSFEEDPVLITATVPECTGPKSTVTTAGSCLFYFTHAQTYFCSDYTGSGFDFENAEAKCNSRASIQYPEPAYSSTLSCSERTEEIEQTIPGYQGLTGLCVIHCQTEEEFIWNIYTENPEDSCTGFDLFYPEDVYGSATADGANEH